MFQRITNIKHPVLKFLFVYPLSGFLLYCVYQDYVFKNISRTMENREKTDPITKLKFSHEKLEKCQSVEQLIPIYKHTYNHLTKLMIQPEFKRNLVSNCRASYDKQTSIFQSWTKVYVNHYQRQQIYQKGRFYYLFWLNHLKESTVYTVRAEQQIGIIENQIGSRRAKCSQIAYKIVDKRLKASSVENIYQQCLRKTEPIMSLIEKNYEKYLTLQKIQNDVWKIKSLVNIEKQMGKVD